MFLNYLKVAFRTLWKNKKLSLINIAGLAVAIACTLHIFMFVQDELEYDRHHAEAHMIYRVVKDFINDDGSRIPDATTPGPLAAAMQQEIPEVRAITRVFPPWGASVVVEHHDNRTQESQIWRVDSSFFQVFTVPFLKGNALTALSDINSVILTETTAFRHFGKEDPVGKTLKIGGDAVIVTAVIADVPQQAHFHYDFLLPFQTLGPNVDQEWGSYNYYTYVKVREGTDIPAFETKIQQVHDKNVEKSYSDFYTQQLTEIHLNSQLKWELEPNGNQLYVYVLTIIAIFILVIAAINYVNLSTARSSLRAKETGVRKVSGAQRNSLILQFLLESLITCLIAAAVALAISSAMIPIVQELTQKQIAFTERPQVILYLFGTTLLIGVLAGIFPALYLSSFQPVAVLKGVKQGDRGVLNLRKTLVVLQFTISIALIMGAIVIARQMDYIQSKNLGFDKERIVVVRNAGGISGSAREAMLNSIKSIPGVQQVASSSTVLGQAFGTTRLHSRGAEQEIQLNFSSVGYEYLDVIGVELKEGRGFSRDFPTDSVNNGIPGGDLDQRLGGIVINEQAVQEFNLGEPAVGKHLIWAADGDTTYYLEVIGVTNNFHFTSLRNHIKPYGFVLNPAQQNNFTIKLTGDIRPALSSLQLLWQERFPDRDFDYLFLDESIRKLYASEARFQKVFITLVVLGIIIACLGLFALATFSAEQRIKEIGIRKVLGASVAQVVTLLSADFLKLVLIALVFAVPLSIYGMQLWLEGFAYRVSIEWWMFALAGLIALVIALLTISYQAIKAAYADPASSLRSQ